MTRTIKFGVLCPTEQCLAAYVLGSVEVETQQRENHRFSDFPPTTVTCVECGVATQYTRDHLIEVPSGADIRVLSG